MTQVTIGKWGTNLAVRLPGAIVRAAGLHAGERVEIEAQEDAIIIRRVEPRATLEAMFAGQSPEDWRPRMPMPTTGAGCRPLPAYVMGSGASRPQPCLLRDCFSAPSIDRRALRHQHRAAEHLAVSQAFGDQQVDDDSASSDFRFSICLPLPYCASPHMGEVGRVDQRRNSQLRALLWQLLLDDQDRCRSGP
jgi:antitoxin component of MazEF toxin-antitoxin module